jgi:deaminated glutathione amidase
VTVELAIVQVASSSEPSDNRAMLASWDELAADVLVLPEAFARDFGPPGSDVSPYAEDLDGPFVSALVEHARGRTLVAGMFERSDDPRRPFNTVVAVDDDGVRLAYRKVHLYDSFGYKESDALQPGALDQQPVLEIGGVRVGVMTCYDLRFPEIVRPLADDLDLLVVPAAWVAGPRKVHHWRTLITARAIENLVYVAGAAQPAPRYSGTSMVVDPRGDVLVEAGPDATVVTSKVDAGVVSDARAENPSLLNRRL